jgi:hypothetical protein
MGKIIVPVLLLCLIISCSAEKVIKENPTFKDICQNPSLYDGVKITNDIIIKGWSGKDCTFHNNALTKTLNRSDWVVYDGFYCLYVTGGQPKEINLFELPKEGIKASLTSIVRTKEEKVYLEFSELKIVN